MSVEQPRIDQRVFGMRVRSNRAIPFSLPDSAGEVDVLATLGNLPDWSRSAFVEQSLPRDETPYRLERAGDAFMLTYPDQTRFVITRNELSMEWAAPFDFEDACTYLLGGALSLLVRLRGAACLHASSVTLRGRTVAFAGPSGAGKSTLVAALVRRGATLVSEDVLPLIRGNGEILAVPTHCGIRLWPAAVELLTGDREAMPPISPSWDKRAMVAEQVASSPTPLHTVLVFVDRDEPLTPAAAAMHLVANSYRPEMLDGPMRRHEFEIFTEVATSLTVRTFARDNLDPGQLADLVMNAFDVV